MSGSHPWTTEMLSSVIMNSTSCSRFSGCLSAWPKEVPAQVPV